MKVLGVRTLIISSNSAPRVGVERARKNSVRAEPKYFVKIFSSSRAELKYFVKDFGSSQAELKKDQLEPKRAIIILWKKSQNEKKLSLKKICVSNFSKNSNFWDIFIWNLFFIAARFGSPSQRATRFWLEPNQAIKKPARSSQILINEPGRAIKIRLEPSQNELARGSVHPYPKRESDQLSKVTEAYFSHQIKWFIYELSPLKPS